MTLSSLKKDTLGFYHNLLKYLQLLVYLYVRIFPVPLASVRCPTEWYLAPEIPWVNKRWFMARSWLGVLRCKQSSRFSLSDSQNFCSYVTASKAQIQRQKLITILLKKKNCEKHSAPYPKPYLQSTVIGVLLLTLYTKINFTLAEQPWQKHFCSED